MINPIVSIKVTHIEGMLHSFITAKRPLFGIVLHCWGGGVNDSEPSDVDIVEFEIRYVQSFNILWE